MIAARATHALSDGGHWVIAYNSLERPPKRPLRQWIYTHEELFHQYFKSFKTPCSMDIERDSCQLMRSHSPQKTAEVVDVIFRVLQSNFACYDTKLKKPVAMTEHSWASMLVAAVLHNWELTGKVDTSKSGIMTLVNMRPWIDKKLDFRCIGNCYSRVLPKTGAFSIDETLGAVMGRMRESMTRQLKDLEHLKVLRQPLAAPSAAPMIISNPGPIFYPKWIITGRVKEVVSNLDPEDTSEWPFMITHANLRFGDRPPNQWVLTHANKVVLSDSHIVAFQKRVMKGLVELTLDLTFRQALAKIEPRIKGII
jgi:hypothetical protein